MIHGRNPAGYVLTSNDHLSRLELESRQCVHCQFQWIYDPFKEARARNLRGFCLRCHGFTCERPECHMEQRVMLSEYHDEPRPCISFEEHYRRRLDRINGSSQFEVTPSGVIVPKGTYSDIPGLEGLR
jgi:hypothetical protein